VFADAESLITLSTKLTT